ncbi:RNA-directed DNA polymerase, eukaryota [Tanacetum coccineum]
MGTKIKGVFKGFKFISNIFVIKEREMEIGYPTDVKHVAHIGWDGSSGSAPAWMNEFKTAPDFAATSIGNAGSAMSTWSSQDFGEAMGRRPSDDVLNDLPTVDLPNIPKKQRRKKSKSTCSPKSSSSRSSRAAKAKANTETIHRMIMWVVVKMKMKALHGEDGKLGYPIKSSFSSNWIDIVRTLPTLFNKGIDLLGYIKKRLEMGKILSSGMSLGREMRNPRSGSEQSQMAMLLSHLEGIHLPNMLDRWSWSLSGDGEFSLSSTRNLIDDKTLGTVGSKTQWCKYVSLKVNILSWRVKLNNLLTRLNLSHRGMDIQYILCPSCNLAVESTNHIFFSCPMMKVLYKSIARWWDVNLLNISSYEDWWAWFSSLRLFPKLKLLLEGVFYITWWSVWNFRNKSIFGPIFPSKARLFDDIVALSFTWCRSRSKLNFSCIDWLKNPLIISL